MVLTITVFVGILLLTALRFRLHRPLASKQDGALFFLTAKQAPQLCAEPRAAEHVDGKVEGGVEVAEQNGNIAKEQKVLQLVNGRVKIKRQEFLNQVGAVQSKDLHRCNREEEQHAQDHHKYGQWTRVACLTGNFHPLTGARELHYDDDVANE
ncbi:hypothetical protein DPMN_088864 [Dreissena polymorpha]|uniref:Uncharacterized protein n=1 Tax=Dreissena polymorpha TaxID=45954 RepID=A0A9D4KUV7_DREPO|nr:hypothetical protein DPMN_088864 [Dreissena polymorpha]